MKTIVLTIVAARKFDALPEWHMGKPQIITASNGEELVVVPKAECEAWVDAAEELADIAAFDAAKADVEGSKPLTAEETARRLGRG